MLVMSTLLIASILYGCKVVKKESKTQKEIPKEHKTITLPYSAHRDLLAQHQCQHVQPNEVLLYRADAKNTIIHLYELENNYILRDSFSIPTFLQNKNPRFSIISKDSILFYDKYDFWGTYLLCRKTNKIDTLHFPPHPNFRSKEEFYHYIEVVNSNMPLFKYPYLYVRVNIWTEKMRNEQGIILKYDISQQKGTYFLSYPNNNVYAENKKRFPRNTYNGIEYHFNFTLYEDKIIGFYPVFDTLYIYDVNTHELIQKKKIPSKYVKIPPREIKNNENGYFYATEIPFYKRILYDPFKEVFYIIIKHDMSPEVSIRQGDESFSILVLDKNLLIIKEWFFEGRKYDCNNVLILPEGVYISKTTNDTKNDEKQSFVGFNLLH